MWYKMSDLVKFFPVDKFNQVALVKIHQAVNSVSLGITMNTVEDVIRQKPADLNRATIAALDALMRG